MDDVGQSSRQLADEVEALARTVDELRRDLDDERGLVEELQLALTAGARPLFHEPVYADWQTWVDEWLTTRVSRSPHRFRWCHQYADHPEVADRLEALWHTWEAAWPDPQARLTWFRDGLDHHLAVISAEDGPLRSCSASENQHEIVKVVHPDETSIRSEVYRT